MQCWNRSVALPSPLGSTICFKTRTSRRCLRCTVRDVVEDSDQVYCYLTAARRYMRNGTFTAIFSGCCRLTCLPLLPPPFLVSIPPSPLLTSSTAIAGGTQRRCEPPAALRNRV